MELEPLYTPEDVKSDYATALGNPGEYPFTRGVYPSMYPGKLVAMVQFAGFGTPEDTNARLQLLVRQGQTGLAPAVNTPTLLGYDADHERDRGEVGREVVSVS